MDFEPHPYQTIAMKWALNRPYCGLILDMGLGKTAVTLTVIKQLLDCVEILKPIIVAPKMVTEQTWAAEIEKWPHLHNLDLSIIAGTEKKRITALKRKADIYIISRDNIAWLVNLPSYRWNFDMLVLDELSSFKNRTSQRFRAIRKIRPKVNRVIGLTGTPAPNGLIDLWSQLYLLDEGQRLGKTVTSYRIKYFHPEKSNGHIVYTYGLNKQAEQGIYDSISDICLSMRAEDWLTVPARQDIIKELVLDDYSQFKKFKETQVLNIAQGEISANNAAALYNKLLQYANGAVYDDDKNYHVVHDKKLDAIEEAVEELQGKPVIIFYQFRSDIERLTNRFKDIRILKTPQDIRDWNNGKINILLAHPASAGHGLNLQQGGNYIFWFGLPWSLELYQQAVARLHRQGQTQIVFNYHFMVKGTPEYEVYSRLLDKTLTQDKLIDALRQSFL